MSEQHPRLKAPEQIAEEFTRAWNAAEAEALADLFTAEADFVNVVELWWADSAHNTDRVPGTETHLAADDESGGARLAPVSYQRTRTGPRTETQAAANGEVRPGT